MAHVQFSGPRLRERRLAAGLGLEELAIAVDRSYYSVAGYERGRLTPSAKILLRLADVLGCLVDDLLDDMRGAGAA